MVASEVRNLAQRLATAAREIKTLISSSVEQVQAASMALQDSATRLSDEMKFFRLP